MAATLLPGALSFHFAPTSVGVGLGVGVDSAAMSSAIVSISSSSVAGCSMSSSSASMADGLHWEWAPSSSRSAKAVWECLKGPVFASTGAAGVCRGHSNGAGVMRAGGGCEVFSSRVSSFLPLFLSSKQVLRQQARAVLLQRSRRRVHRSVRAYSLKDSQREALHEVEEQSKPIVLGTPPSSGDGEMIEEDGVESILDNREGEDVHSSDSGRDAADSLAARAEEEGFSLKEEVKGEEEDVSGAVKGTIVATIVLIGIVGAFGGAGIVYKEQINDFLTQFSDFIEGYGPAGYGLFVLAYAGLEIIAIPAVPLTMSAGLLFGTLYGTILVSIAGTLAATIAFLIARYLVRDKVLKMAQNNPKFLAIDKAIGADGFRVVTLLRLSPLLPFSLGNYLYGCTSVDLVPYILGSWLGMLPGTWAYVSAGAFGRAFIKQESEAAFPGGPEQYWTLGIGIVATVVAASYISRLAKEAMKNIENE